MSRLISMLCFMVLMSNGAASQSLETDPVSKLMSLKLDYAHQILESVIKQDPDAIKELAFRLSVLSATADWRVIRTPEYNQHTNDFRRAVEALRNAHKGDDLDSAALAYVDMTLRCVQCHKYVREYRTTFEPEK